MRPEADIRCWGASKRGMSKPLAWALRLCPPSTCRPEEAFVPPGKPTSGRMGNWGGVLQEDLPPPSERPAASFWKRRRAGSGTGVGTFLQDPPGSSNHLHSVKGTQRCDWAAPQHPSAWGQN